MAEQGCRLSPDRPGPGLWRTLRVVVVLLAASAACATGAGIASLFSRRLAWRCAQLWGVAWLWAAGVRVRVSGFERLDRYRRYVFVANHQSALDIPVLYACVPFRVTFISKRSLFYIPVVGWGMLAVGHIWVNRSRPRSARESIRRAVEKLGRDNTSLVIFPEGTRSMDGTIREFKRGSFALAIEAGVDLVPLYIRGTCEVLPKGALLYRSASVSLSAGQPIGVSGLTMLDKQALTDQVRERMLRMADREAKGN